MPATRNHVASIWLDASCERVFRALHTPSEIRVWWSADYAVVIPRLDGIWMAVWGDDEDQPKYISSGRICEFEPPRRLMLNKAFYFAREGEPPFDSSHLTTCFEIESEEKGCRLRVEQDGFPADGSADQFVQACEVGWRDTLAAIKAYVESQP